MTAPERYPWQCPSCACDEFLRCECGFLDKYEKFSRQWCDHGQTAASPCLKAECAECGWKGQLPAVAGEEQSERRNGR